MYYVTWRKKGYCNNKKNEFVSIINIKKKLFYKKRIKKQKTIKGR